MWLRLFLSLSSAMKLAANPGILPILNQSGLIKSKAFAAKAASSRSDAERVHRSRRPKKRTTLLQSPNCYNALSCYSQEEQQCRNGGSLLPNCGKTYPSNEKVPSSGRPIASNNHQLCLALKDNIDVKGVVTTAGSEYVAKTSSPASQDAECLAIARKRNVRIVGKANLSEICGNACRSERLFWNPAQPPMIKWLGLSRAARPAAQRQRLQVGSPMSPSALIQPVPYAFPQLVAASLV
jgi:hypothetical protein